MTALFIVNPDSQTVKSKGSVLGRIKTSERTAVEYLDDFSVMPAIAKRAAKDKVSHVFVEGGDGTAHGVLTAFLSQEHSFVSLPRFTLLAGGMTNQVARNIGIKRPTPQNISSMLESGAGQTHKVPLLKIETRANDPKFGFLFSTGGIPAATEYCKKAMHGRGIGGTAAVAATIVRGVAGSKAARDNMMPPTAIALHIEGGGKPAHIQETHLGSLVTTLPGLIMNLDPFWGRGEGPLRLTYAREDATHLVRNLAGLWMGRTHINRANDGLRSFNADALHYDYFGPCVLDGETIEPSGGHIDIHPTAPVTFLA